MQVVHEGGNFKTLAFKRGEEVMRGLLDYFQSNDIRAAHLAGLGAVDQVELAFYNHETKEYERHNIEEELELVNLNGNVGVKADGGMVVHMHGTFGKRDLSVIGGHIFSMTIAGAGEIHVQTFSGQINRAYDEETGLISMCKVDE